MSAWILVACLKALRGEINEVAPGRDRATDGAVADAHHSASSDHAPDEDSTVLRDRDADRVNEVHAIDVDKDLRTPGWSMDRVVRIIVTRHRQGLDDRLQNVIWNRRIWSRSWGWTARTYTGDNPHDKHAHFSARYTSAQEADTSPWGLLEEDDMALSADDKKWLEERFAAQPAKIWAYDVDPSGATQTAYGALFTNLARSGTLANVLVPGVLKAVAEIAEGEVDPEVLAAAVAAKIPASGEVTVDKLRDAIVAAARELITAQPAIRP